MKLFRWVVPLHLLCLLLLAPHLSLWLDEVLTLIGSAKPDWPALLDYIRTVPGGLPLAFLLPRWSVEVLGNSALAARVPSILASTAALPAVLLLAKRLEIRTPWIALLLFAALPLQLRYALEARPYALALCLTLWLSVVFLERWSSLAYVAIAIIAVFAQPYAVFIVAAHLVSAFLTDRPRIWTPLLALVASAVALLPWYLYFQHDWTAVNDAQQIAAFDPRASLVFLHEISGSGYIGAALLLGGALAGGRLVKQRAFWLSCAIVPLLAAFAGNVVFHYFFSIRQVIYVLPILALLFLAGTQSLGRPGQIMTAALLLASLYADFEWFRKPREDWRAAADAATAHVQAGACIVFLGDSTPLYLHFRPELDHHRCAENPTRVVLGLTPYGDARLYPDAVAKLEASGLSKQSVQEFAGPRVEVFAK